MSVRMVEEFIFELERRLNDERRDRVRRLMVSPRIYDDVVRDPAFHPSRERGIGGYGHDVLMIRGVEVRSMKIFKREDAVAWESEESCGACLIRRESRYDYGRMYDPREIPVDAPMEKPQYKIDVKPAMIGPRSFIEELKEI